MISTKLAIDSVVTPFTEDEISDAGVIVGTALGGIHSIASFDRESLVSPQYVNPMTFPNTVINASASQVSIKYGMRSMNVTICTGQAAGMDAIGYAFNEIKRRGLKTAFAGGVEELCEETYAAFGKNDILKTSGDETAFLSEGAAMFCLENMDVSERTGRSAIAEIVGYASICDAGFDYVYNPLALGAREAMRLAMEEAGVSAGNIRRVYSGCYETTKAGAMQSAAFETLFGADARRLEIKNIKPFVGECIGAFGAMEIAVALHDLTDGDENFVMVNVFGCNGMNSSMILKRVTA
jgi:3-oxoacyl-[acyl-carrier-protein] synthase II